MENTDLSAQIQAKLGSSADSIVDTDAAVMGVKRNPNGITIKRVIQRCGCDKVLPLCLVYIFYIILHGHLSPGGGFQGGILTVAAVLLIYLGHGYQETKRALSPNLMRPLEGLALIIYVVLALSGVVLGAQFCQNLFYLNGDIGALISSGTIAWMDEAVAFNVITGSIVLSIGVLSILFPQDVDSRK